MLERLNENMYCVRSAQCSRNCHDTPTEISPYVSLPFYTVVERANASLSLR